MLGVISSEHWIAAASAMVMVLASHTCRGDSIGTAPLIAWSCWLGSDSRYSIHCLNDGEPILPAATPARNLTAGPEHFRQDLFAAGAAPNLARLVRTDPAAYDGRLWLIPMFAAPFDVEHVRLLARSVMCGSDPRCTVQFLDTAAAPPGMGMLR